MATLYERYITGDDAYAAFYGDDYLAQTFTPSTSHLITSVKLMLNWFFAAFSDTVTVSIRRTDANGRPTGSDLASGTLSGDNLASTPAWHEITLGASVLAVSGTKYATVVKCPDAGVAGVPVWRRDTSGSYTGGWRVNSNDYGVTWSDSLDDDFMFEEWGEPRGTGGGGGGTIFPTEAITRVTNLIHRYNRKGQVYTLEMQLGEVTSDFGLPQWLSEPTSATPGVRTEQEIMQEVTEIRNKIADELGMIQEQQLRLPTRTEEAIMSEVTKVRNEIADELGKIQRRSAALAPSPTFVPEALARAQAPVRKRRAPTPPRPRSYTPSPLTGTDKQTEETKKALAEARRKLAESMPGW